VSLNFVANVLLSAGASPAMVDNPEEAGLFAGVADGVVPDPLTGLVSANVHFSVRAEGARQGRRIEAPQFRRGFC
jgi:hydroxyethylthiazole kinase